MIKKVGFIGLGKMGIPMVQNLLKADYDVSIYNRSKIKAANLITAGAKFIDTPATLLTECELLIIMVSDDKAISDLFTGDEGLLASTAKGKTIINMSTVSPNISKEMAALCLQNGNFYIDAPVSGSVKQATEGTLVIMAGGEEKAFETAKPIFDCLGKLALLVGDTGAGNAAKLAINAMLALHAQGLAETVLFAQQQGIATNQLMELVNNSALGNIFIKIKGDAILNDNYEAAFALKHIVKDLGLAKAQGLNSPLANAAYQSFTQAPAALAEEDIISIIKDLN